MRTLRNIALVALLLTPVLLTTGCSWLYGEDGLVKNNEYSYLDSEMSTDLKLPEGINAIQIVDEYPIPEISKEAESYVLGADLTAIAPTIILAVDSRSGVYTRDEKYAPTVWFRIKEIRIWQALLDYMSDNNIPVLKKDTEEGIIETDWLETDQSGWFASWFGSDEPRALREKFRFTLSKSPKGNLQLLSVQNTNSQWIGYDESSWHDDDTSRKQAILFMNDFLGTWSEEREFAARKRVLEANKGIALEIGHDNNENLAFMASADFQQTWEKLATVLPEIHFKIDDKDQTLGIYFIEYNGVESAGFFESLKFWNSNDDDGLPIEEGDYQLNLSAMGDKTAITLATEEGVILSADLLNKLYPYFSEQFGRHPEMDNFQRKRNKEDSRRKDGKGGKGKHKSN